MSCKHCKQFFQTLHRRCTIHLNGECDCPVCQGLCCCTNRSPELPNLTTADTIHYTADEVQTITIRKFGDKR